MTPTVESRSLYERLYAAYSWVVDSDLPMRREHAPILLEAAEEVKRLQTELEMIKAERAKVASGKVNCEDCGAILARF